MGSVKDVLSFKIYDAKKPTPTLLIVGYLKSTEHGNMTCFRILLVGEGSTIRPNA